MGIALAIITWLALTPDPPAASQLISWDKANHGIAFFVLAFLVHFSLLKQFNLGWGLLFLYGAGIEVAQASMGYRYFEWSDMLANTVSILLYVICRPILFKLPAIQLMKPEQEL